MGVLSRVDWRNYFPPLTSRTFLAHYLPASGAVSHTLFTMHIFNPSFISKMFPVGDLAVSNSMLFNANLGIGFYVFFRHHMHKLNSVDRVEFSVYASTLFNFGSMLGAVCLKALLPHRLPSWVRGVLGASLSLYLLSRGRKYLHYIDDRSARGSPSPRRSPIKEFERNDNAHYSNGDTPQTHLNGSLANGI